MTETVESLHYKFISRIDSLTELSIYLDNVAKHLGIQTKNPTASIYITKDRYDEGSYPILSDYYDNVKSNKLLFADYKGFIMSENIISDMNLYINELKKCSSKIQSQCSKFFKTHKTNIPEFICTLQTQPETQEGTLSQLLEQKIQTAYLKADQISFNTITPDILPKLSFAETVHKFIEAYYGSKISFSLDKRDLDICDICNGNMITIPDLSELRCNDCGNIITLQGAVFDDSQFYNQQSSGSSKHKRYDFRKHCDKWLKQIQAKENKVIPPKYIDKINKKAIREYTRGNRVRSMNDMKCSQVRQWLRELRLSSNFNNHAALIRKIVTGLNGESIIPPQLTVDEESKILQDFSMAMVHFEELQNQPEILRNLGQETMQNKRYFPYILFKILCIKLRRDPRLKELVSCIHLQSDLTLKKNDIVWKLMCERMEGYKNKYEPTDRTFIL